MECLDDHQLRGSLSDEQRAHVAGCPRCTEAGARVSRLSFTFDSQRTLQREAPPDGVLGEGSEVGAYVARRRLGSGAMGAVYAAWDPRLEREVALKVLHLDGDLLAEARLLAKLSHPHVVAVHEVFTWGGRAVLVMELVHGRTLAEWLKTRPVRERLAVLQQCADGLEAAHAAGIVHRDFKPANVLVDERGRARLVDFGLALHGRVSHGLAGSPAYMALQQLEGAPATPSSDQFAWWVTVHEALLGRVPHDAPTLEGLLEQRREGRLALSGAPRWLRRSLERGLSNEPRRRFASMREASRKLVAPRRVGVVAAALVSAVAIAALAWPSRSACDELTVKPDSLVTQLPALAAAVADYADAQQRCRSLPRKEQAERAGCLDTVGRELDVALAAVTDTPPELAPRVLKRVRPAARCERSPLLPPSPLEPDRAEVIASLRAQLRFDALREQGELTAAATFASEHAKAVASSASPTVRAWAGFNEASGWSMTWRSGETLQRLRGLEGLAGLGPREQAWIALGRWMFECHASSRQHCEVAQRQAQRATAVLDEPWANAFALEVQAVSSDSPPTVRALVDSWRVLPGADFELQRALSNEFGGALVSADPLRRAAALALGKDVPLTSARTRQAQLSLEVAVAVSNGDLAAAAAALSRLEAMPGDGPDLQRARFDARWLVLVARGDSAGALALLEKMPVTEPRARYRRLIIEFVELTLLHSPRAKELLARLELIAGELHEIDLRFYEAGLVVYALKTRDAALLERTPIIEEWEPMRAWQLALLKGDVAAERAVYDAARADPEAFTSPWLALEAALEEGRYDDVVTAAPAVRSQSEALVLEQQVRLAEAWAHWKLGRRDAACRLITLEFRRTTPTPRQLERVEALNVGCPFLGVTAWPN